MAKYVRDIELEKAPNQSLTATVDFNDGSQVCVSMLGYDDPVKLSTFFYSLAQTIMSHEK